MASIHDDYGPLRQHVATIIERKQAQWEQLRWYIDQAKEFPREDYTWIITLNQEKSLLQRSVRKKLKSLRRQYRKDYSAKAAQNLKDWRPSYERGMARAKPYQRDIINLRKHEVHSLQSVYSSMKKLRVMFEKLCKRLKK